MEELPAWINRGKSVAQLIKELETFENKEIEVKISVDSSKTLRPISLVLRDGNICILEYSGD
jgi:predicted ribosome-associated RNA-binding protein Tma20